jgi:hypothetical protein
MSRTLPPPALPNAPGELRQDPLSGGWVAITAGRAARPEAFLGDVGAPRGPLGCPFCPGNEHMTPPEVWADRDPGTEPDRPGWHVRVVPNKFPAFAGPPVQPHHNGGLYRSEPTAGVHEVVIHNPDHEATLADLPAPTLVVMAISDWFVANWYIIFPVIGGGIYGFLEAWKRSVAVQIFMDKLMLKAPIFGHLVRISTIARWTRTLSTMFAAGVPLDFLGPGLDPRVAAVITRPFGIALAGGLAVLLPPGQAPRSDHRLGPRIGWPRHGCSRDLLSALGQHPPRPGGGPARARGVAAGSGMDSGPSAGRECSATPSSGRRESSRRQPRRCGRVVADAVRAEQRGPSL